MAKPFDLFPASTRLPFPFVSFSRMRVFFLHEGVLLMMTGKGMERGLRNTDVASLEA